MFIYFSTKTNTEYILHFTFYVDFSRFNLDCMHVTEKEHLWREGGSFELFSVFIQSHSDFDQEKKLETN